jgi:hypothetical protein
MSQQAHSKPRVGVAILGMIFCDFLGVLVFGLPTIGWVAGLGVMFLGSPYVAWLALENHPRRAALTIRIAIVHTVVLLILITLAIAFLIYALSNVQWG